MVVAENGDLEKGTAALAVLAQEEAIRTNYIKHRIDRSRDSPTCRMCGFKGETVNHVIFESSKLAQK